MTDVEINEILATGNETQKEKAALLVHSNPQLASQQTLELLKDLLKHRHWHIRRAAALGLIASLGTKARPLVQHLLQDKAWGVRQDVGEALKGTTRKKSR